MNLKRLAPLILACLLMSQTFVAEAIVGKLKTLVVPVIFPKSGTVTRAPANDIRAAYAEIWEGFWKETSYDKFNVDTKTYSYLIMPWPRNPGGGSGPDFNTDGGTGSGIGESLGIEKVIDGVFTPGERFLDLNGDGGWSDFEPFTDILVTTSHSNLPSGDVGKFNKYWDANGEWFLDINNNGTYDNSVTITIYSEEFDLLGDAGGNKIKDKKGDGGAANFTVTVDEFSPRKSLEAFINAKAISSSNTYTTSGCAITADGNVHFHESSLWSWDPKGDSTYNGDFQHQEYLKTANGNIQTNAATTDNALTYSPDTATYRELVGKGAAYLESESIGNGDFDNTTFTLKAYEVSEPFTDGIIASTDGSPSVGNGVWDDRDPFEDFMIRWNWQLGTLATWTSVTDTYIQNNYPVTASHANLIIGGGRTNDGNYDAADQYTNVSNTKIRPGGTGDAVGSPSPENRHWDPHNWFDGTFDTWWQQTFSVTTSPTFNGFRRFFTEFDIESHLPTTLVSGSTALLSGNHVIIDKLSPFTDTSAASVVPSGAMYDSAREFRDMPSSLYHSAGDGRFGEETDPNSTSTDGADYGNHLGTSPVIDGFIEAAGPLSYNIFGDSGFDAGNQSAIEFMTWRTDGTHMTNVALGTVTYSSNTVPTNIGDSGNRECTDVNLDGLIDQGEAVAKGFNNYIVDTNPLTPDNGVNTDYPWNRARVVEDCIEALDAVEDFDSFNANQRTVDYIAVIHPDQYPGTNFADLSGLSWSCYTRDNSTSQISGGGHVTRFTAPAEGETVNGGHYAMSVVAHEASHDWHDWPDLYDYDILIGTIVNDPMGDFDNMSAGPLVHHMPVLKQSAGWTDVQSLKDILIPGTSQTVDFFPVEQNTGQYYHFTRETGNTSTSSPERYWFWYESGDSTYYAKTFAAPNGPTSPIGMLMMHEDGGWDPQGEDAPVQQRLGDHYNYEMIQADGKNHLQDNVNRGTSDDVWPGALGKTSWGKNTTPNNFWFDQVDSGLEILNIEVPADQFSPLKVTFLWKEKIVPSLTFINPPGGKSQAGFFNLVYDAFDQYGGSTITVYRDNNNSGYDGTLIATNTKAAGDTQRTVNTSISALADGSYYFYAMVAPGVGESGTEVSYSTPFAGHDNAGNGTVTISALTAGNAITTGTSSAQVWTLKNVGSDRWSVTGSITGAETNQAATGTAFTTAQNYTGGLTFTITAGTVAFGTGDTFTFQTAGLTAYSQPIEVVSGAVPVPPSTPKITVTQPTGNTAEGGQGATFKVVLKQQPTANVTIAIESSDTTEATVSPSSLLFTSTDWVTPKTVTVTGVDDTITDGNIAVEINLKPATSSDPAYNGENPENITMLNVDNESQVATDKVTVSAISGPVTEAGGTATFTIVLNEQPTDDVVINFTSNDTTEGTVSPSGVTFTDGNWDTPQEVTVTGVDDTEIDEDVSFQIEFGLVNSADPDFDNQSLNPVTVVNEDDDNVTVEDGGNSTSTGSGTTGTTGGTTTTSGTTGNESGVFVLAPGGAAGSSSGGGGGCFIKARR